MKIKLDHVNMTVGNMNESIDWYGRVFGFELVERGVNQSGRPWAIVAHDDSMICMTEYRERKSAAQQGDQGFHQFYHFGIRVSDEREWQEKVDRFKLKVKYGGVCEYPRSKSWYVADPNGHEIEVSYAGAQPLQFPTMSDA